ncbi:MlaD family protein [Nocardioides sp. TRM66260-LWL]|uniref:MlaD family protein n=1 Tax=Nocardioides sp. TRM66260-LWL TaxID=2874478 RepID=UPI001CC37B40|nr:MlaD family protein [Nocardioides sp. TRM66260-LWL]MBZ5735309.1 MlaD family protein [Nocardioides sp. TRM66260-LWL]
MTASTALSRASSLVPTTRRARRGLALLVVIAVVITGLAFKSQIKARLSGREVIRAEFAQNYNLQPYISKVKMAGLQVGVVTGVDRTDAGTALVTMRIDDSARDRLGDHPSARVAPLTILGGQYGVELTPGGSGPFAEGVIPVDDTATPVELDQILDALPADTRTATRGLVRNTNRVLEQGGSQGLRRLSGIAPGVLPDAGSLLRGLQGTRPTQDLASLVTYLQSTAEVLDQRRTRVGAMIDDLDRTSAALSSSSDDLAATIAQMPSTLDATDRGVTKLDRTLQRLGRTTRAITPAVERLGPLVEVLQPTLREARPTVAQLPPIVARAQRIIAQLVPTASDATAVVDAVRGPVIKRVDGPILDYLAHTWRGKKNGPYPNSGGGIQADNKMYEEIAYMIVNLDRASMTQDAQGSLLNFQAGVGLSTIQPLALDEALAKLLPAARQEFQR